MVEMVKTKINGEFTIVLPKHRADRQEWYTQKGWEKKRLKHMHKNIGDDDMVYYIGAEEGEFPALCRMWGAYVVMFEPNDKAWPNIKAVWEANLLPPVATFHGFASSVTIGNPEWRFGFPECAYGEIVPDHGFSELKEPANKQQITIDDFKLFFGLPPTVICLDVEGSEGHVLRGAENVLREYHPKIYLSLHPEFLHDQYGEWGAELRDWIINLGYKETLIDYPLHEVHLYYEALI